MPVSVFVVLYSVVLLGGVGFPGLFNWAYWSCVVKGAGSFVWCHRAGVYGGVSLGSGKLDFV